MVLSPLNDPGRRAKGEQMGLARRIYRRLARAFPHEFKLNYGSEMLQLGDEVAEEVSKEHGVFGPIRLIADMAIRLPIEYLDEMRHDLRYALRAMIKSPGFALVGVISMALGIGLTTVVYSSKWKLISADLPAAANANRLVMPETPVSYYDVEHYRQQTKLFSGVAAFQTGVAFNVIFAGDVTAKPERVFGQLVSPDYFSVLGVEAQRGRVLNPLVDRTGDATSVVISDRFWRNRLNSSPDAIGQTLRLNGQLATIVGITPKRFNGALGFNPAELFVPITAPAALAPELANDVLHQRNARDFLALICLAPGTSIDTAEAALDAITRQLHAQDSSATLTNDKSRRVSLESAGGMVPIPRKLKPVVAGFFLALMALIMIIASMNLGNMLLARGACRRKELAIRLAVGASRFRIVRQMISEGILLSALGGIAGFALAYGLARLNSHFTLPAAAPIESDFTPDWHAAVFVFLLVVISGVGFSLAPALRATKTVLTPALKEGSALQLPGYRRLGLRNLLIVAQVTGSLMLLLITGFLVIGFTRAATVHTRFDPHTMYLLSLDPVREGYTPDKAQALFEKIPARLKSAGVADSVALATQAPYSVPDEDAGTPLTAENSGSSSRVQISAIEESVGGGYFAALNEPMLNGREFTEQDQRRPADDSVAIPAILSPGAARQLFGNGKVIGERLRDEHQAYEVVGVAPELASGLGTTELIAYLPLTGRDFARPPAGGITIMARSKAGAEALNGIRREIASIDPHLTVFNVRTLNDDLERSRSVTLFAVNTYGGMGVFGLVLAAIGLAGVTAYAVAQRRKEIGIRMALGARKGQVLRLVLREATALVSVGTVLGLLGAFALAKVLSALTSVFVDALKVGTNDPRLIVGAPLLLAGLALLASYVPARRAAKIDPLTTIREE